MISKAMQTALNKQINKEIYSAYVYLALSGQSAIAGLPGISRWFKLQYDEELGHAMRIFDYMMDQNAPVDFDAIQKPAIRFDSPLPVFKKVLHHEQEVTKSVHHLMDLALNERDHATHNMLEWFVREQVEEDSSVQKIIDSLQIIGKEGSGLFVLDRDLGNRQPDEAEDEEA